MQRQICPNAKMMTMTIKEEYEASILMQIQECYYIRKESNMSQSEMAERLRVSLKTIQRFEHYKTMSGYLIFGYKKLLSIE